MGFYKRMSDKQSEIKRYNAARRKADKLSSTPLFKTTFSWLITKKTDEVYIERDIDIVFICFLKTESIPHFLR